MSLDFHLTFPYLCVLSSYLSAFFVGRIYFFLPLLYFHVSTYLSFLAFFGRIKWKCAVSLSVFKLLRKGGLGTNEMIKNKSVNIYALIAIFLFLWQIEN